MIPPEAPLTPDSLVRHDEGLLYQVQGIRMRTDNYETTRNLSGASVDYVQLEDGDLPAGTEYNKDEKDFRAHFTIVPADSVDASSLNPQSMNKAKLQEIIQTSALIVHDGAFIFAKVGATPNPKDCFVVAVDEDEISVVVREKDIAKVDVLERNKDTYRLIELRVSLPFYAVGFLAAATGAISAKGCNNLVVSTYSKDFVLVRTEQFQLAYRALIEAGFKEAK